MVVGRLLGCDDPSETAELDNKKALYNCNGEEEDKSGEDNKGGDGGGNVKCVVETSLRYLTYRAVRLGLWELAIDLANKLPKVRYFEVGEILREGVYRTITYFM